MGDFVPTHSSPIPAIAITDKAANLAHGFIGTTLTLFILMTIIVLARVYTRAVPVFRFTADDYVICAAYVFVTALWGMLYSTVDWAMGGKHPATRNIDQIETAFMLGTLAEPVWAWSMGLIKISVACMLLRLQQSRKWRIFLFVMIAIQVIVITYNTLANLLQCIPLEAAWDLQGKIKHKTCWNTRSYKICTTTTSTINVITDIIFSLSPISFLRKIRRPNREKVVIGVLMSLGLVASAVSLWKTVLAQAYNQTTDTVAQGITFGFMSCVEGQVALLAACIPCLRSPVQRTLAKFGLLYRKARNSGWERYGEGSSISGGPKGMRKKMANMQVDLKTIPHTGPKNDAEGTYEDPHNTPPDEERGDVKMVSISTTESRSPDIERRQEYVRQGSAQSDWEDRPATQTREALQDQKGWNGSKIGVAS